MAQALIIGDVHKHWNRYINILNKTSADRTIQVGDFGINEKEGYEDREILIERNRLMKSEDHKFIRGNHDDLSMCNLHNCYIPDGKYENDTGIFYFGGSEFSPPDDPYDKYKKHDIYTAYLDGIASKYDDAKPRIVISHDCPEVVAVEMFHHYKIDGEYRKKVSKDPYHTRNFLSLLWTLHQPEVWIFGHWHIRVTKYQKMKNQSTKFVCLSILETMKIEV